MAAERREQVLHEAFELSLALKAVVALSEFMAGIALWLVPNSAFTALAMRLTAQEISEDPSDRLANALLHAAQGFSMQAQDFFALYLASHGAIKLAVVAALFSGALWAYPLALVVLAGFVVYQLYRLSLGLSWPLVGLTLFDLIVMALVWHEYRRIAETRR